MIKTGVVQELEVLRVTQIGVYLGSVDTEADPLAVFASASPDPLAAFAKPAAITGKTPDTAGTAAGEISDVLLPNNEMTSLPTPLKVGDRVSAFIYLDSKDRPIATLKKPALTLGGIAKLTVKQINNIGAFLDWGLPKDLMLPYKEQTGKLNEGDEVLVTLYHDKSKRLCASMKIYKKLRTDSEYKSSDRVHGRVYEILDRTGAFVAVDDVFSALIPNREMTRKVQVGEYLELRVCKVQPDGKLELSMREPSYLQLDKDCEIILTALKATKNGFLPYHDKSDSEVIREVFSLTKNSFKRAIGHLMKQQLIEIHDDGILLNREK